MYYFIKVYFGKGKKVNGIWSYDMKILELEKCKLENFSPKYRENFRYIENIEDYYCIKNINDILEGYHYSNNYTFFQIYFFPCNEQMENITKCHPSNILEDFFQNVIIEILFPDVELSPQIYKTPIKFGKRGTSFPANYKLYSEVALYFHKLNIETDEDNFGLSQNIKKESYLKYDSYQIFSSLRRDDSLDLYYPIASIIIQLSDKIMTVKRKYNKLIDILGSIGGIMGVIYSFFQIMISFLADILYDIS